MARGRAVRALVRPNCDGSRLKTHGVEIVRGDMMDPDSLVRAMTDVDAVVTTAAGYTRHSKGDAPDIDVVGNRNLADAAAAGVRRFVLTSILICDRTPRRTCSVRGSAPRLPRPPFMPAIRAVRMSLHHSTQIDAPAFGPRELLLRPRLG